MPDNFSLTAEDAATIKRRRIVSIISIIIFLALSAAICWFVGRPLIEFVSEPERFRLWVDSHGIWGRLAFIGMVAVSYTHLDVYKRQADCGDSYPAA